MIKKTQRNNKSPINKSQILRTVLFVSLIALVFGSFFLLKKFFIVKNIECQLLSDQACSPELIESLSSLHGSSMFFENYNQKLEQSQTLNQPVSLVHFQKLFPSTVIVTLQEEPPSYVAQFSGTTTVVSVKGRVFNHQVDSSGLILVEIPDTEITPEGFVANNTHQVIVTIINTASQLQLPLTKITWVDKSTIKLSMENRTEQFIIDSEYPMLELTKLSVVLKSGEYRDIPEPKQELDLRFAMPVLRTQL